MDLFSRYAINTPDVVAEDFNGEIVILNLANGHYFSLCGIACAIWSLLLAGHTPHSIVASIEASRPDLVEGSSQFVERLLELQLILATRRHGSFCRADRGTMVGRWSGDRGLRRPCGADFC